MKIVNLAAFRLLPPNTVFSKYTPCMFEDIAIKTEQWECDFMHQPIATAVASRGSHDSCEKLDAAYATGVSVSMDFNSPERDGCFEDDQLFAVWEPGDVAALISRLRECLPPDFAC